MFMSPNDPIWNYDARATSANPTGGLTVFPRRKTLIVIFSAISVFGGKGGFGIGLMLGLMRSRE
jgi:hypothetical protein